MNKQIEVIKAFHIPVETDVLEEMEKTHSYISDKLILDAVNGVNVVARDLHQVQKSRTSFVSRMFDGFSGSSRKRQDLINENLIEGLNACTKWLRDHDRHITRIDSKIFDIANEMMRTQDEILKFYSQHLRLKNEVADLKDIFYTFRESANQQFDYLREYIKSIDIRTKAMDVIELEFSRLESEKYNNFTIPAQIYIALDNIKSGYGGIYYDYCSPKEQNDFRELIGNKLKSHFKPYSGELLDYEKMVKDFQELNPIEKEGLSFISTQHYNTIIQSGQYPEVADMLSIVTTYEPELALQELDKQSNIRNFFTYKDFIETALDEHLKV